ncbi:MAG: thiopurine S-methyltransferase [Balneola sp.]|jgi:thiopurine S-methyltransferase|nr:thiopurine S-methyltransferase [Balneola sp.]MBE79389.1 thiopurine S-methyltransferase [Balneola sp.]HBX65429.1 thiopurine S-methyltransferase [Balneolaceae bacterium]|tara:strand:- start:83 stop:718 length:636 start_codon:yes stop_codon:yes gene_type:complete
MNPDFWHQKWKNNQIGFHNPIPHPLLIQYADKLSLDKGQRIFLPLCGKTLDIGWLLSEGYRVAGVELNEMAVLQLFEELELEPNIKIDDKLKHYTANNIDIFVGDVFDLTKEMLGEIDAIYDRAALVALPYEMRKQYSVHLLNITHKAPQLILSFEYDQELASGPPFSISEDEIHEHYSNSYKVNHLTTKHLPSFLGGISAKEHVWLLNRN